MAKYCGCLKKDTKGKLELWYDCVSKFYFWEEIDTRVSKAYDTKEKAEDACTNKKIEWLT